MSDYLFTIDEVTEAMEILYRQRSSITSDALRQMEDFLVANADRLNAQHEDEKP